jgi:8-oxo-dGTP pyrophosphatase MutT (NUDIX family)
VSPADRANSRRRQPRRRGSAGSADNSALTDDHPAHSASTHNGATPAAASTGKPPGTAKGGIPASAIPKNAIPRNGVAKSSTSKNGIGKGGAHKGSAGHKSGTGKNAGKGTVGKGNDNHRAKPRARMRTVRETSAGGLVVDGLDGPAHHRSAALIGRTDRRGRLLWSLPKGHIEAGETAEQTAVREVAEETGIRGVVVAELGSIDYWFVTEGRRVHKTVHHYLMRSVGGELSDADVEVTQVAWVPLGELDARLAYADERRLAEVANRLIDRMENGRQ